MLVLWRTAGDVTQAELALAEGLASHFAQVDAHLIHLVVGAMPADVIAPTDETALLQLFDPRNEVARLFGMEDQGIVLLDRNRKFQGAFAGLDPEAALALCRASHDREAPGTITEQAPVLLIPQIFSKSECDALIDYWAHGSKEEGNNLATTDSGNYYDGPQIKRRTDVAIQNKQLFELIKTRIERRVFPELLKSFHFTLARMEMPRVGCYDAAVRGEFRRHRDNTTPYTAHRKFALSINLNEDFDGGEVTFPEYGRKVYKPMPGGGVAFSSSLLHEARPVTRGKRFGLFTFFTDEEGSRRETEMIAKHGNTLKNYTLS